MVDDEQDLVSTNEYILKLLGYKVITTSSSNEALEIFRKTPDIDLVITDQTMPGLTGLQLTKELLKIRADIPVILCTGFVKTQKILLS